MDNNLWSISIILYQWVSNRGSLVLVVQISSEPEQAKSLPRTITSRSNPRIIEVLDDGRKIPEALYYTK